VGSAIDRAKSPLGGDLAARLPIPAFPTHSGASADSTLPACFHCGEPCNERVFSDSAKVFCCRGCQAVHDLLAENGLGHFYDLNRYPGVRMRRSSPKEQWAFLDDPAVTQRLIEFSDGEVSRTTFHIPAIHCVACIWLLENLFRLHGGVGKSVVNFARREVTISFAARELQLSDVVVLLASLGYEPALNLGSLEERSEDRAERKQWLQLGVAGFAFGNIMLFSLPGYLGFDSLSGPLFRSLFGWLSLILALPVLIYSSSDYWRAAVLSFRHRVLTLDVPIALGLGALYGQSAFEILSGRGEGYLDSMAGLVFLLLCGRVFQKKTHERILFDRDYKSFFPLSVVRKRGGREETVALSAIEVGDHLVLRNGELIPADSRLLSGTGSIDYSFVTGESETATKVSGDYLYAGGQQSGSAIEVETVKPVSQSYLTSLWSHEAFSKNRDSVLDSLTNRYSQRFTKIVVAVAVVAGAGWLLAGQLDRGLKAFASVLIVACPCALALAAPFALGTAQRLLGRLQVFVKNGLVLEKLARANMVVFDKTGTLTSQRTQTVSYSRREGGVAQSGSSSIPDEQYALSICRQSTHPISTRIAEELSGRYPSLPVENMREVVGGGISATAGGHEVVLGSRAWLGELGVVAPKAKLPPGSEAYLAIDGRVQGAFVVGNSLRPDTEQLIEDLGGKYELALLSGDNERERMRFRELFGSDTQLFFNQTPLDKLGFVRRFQQSGKSVVMVGDGLNDAGALRQSDVGIAVVEKPGAFSPASDLILPACQVARLGRLLRFSRAVTRVVYVSFGISAVYNVVGVGIASMGILSPLICAVLMPLSSVSVVLFACGATTWVAQQCGLTPDELRGSPST